MKINLKIILTSTLCAIIIGVCSGVYLYASLMNIIASKEDGLSNLYLETVGNQLDYSLTELMGLGQCRNDLEIALAMSLNNMTTSSEKRIALRAHEKLNSYLSTYRSWRYVNKLMVFNDHNITAQATTLRVNKLDDVDKVRNTEIFQIFQESEELQMVDLSNSIIDNVECIALICRVYDINTSVPNGWLYMEIGIDIISDNLKQYNEADLYVAKADGTYLLGRKPNLDGIKNIKTYEASLPSVGLKLINCSDSLLTTWSVGSVVNTVFLFLATTLVAAILMTIVIVSLLRESESLRMHRKNAEIALLQSQVNPHFLYNTLESIQWMAKIQKNTGIEKITRCLISLLRNLAKGVGEKINLGEELDLLNDYAELQSIRYMDAFKLINNIPKAFNDYVIIKFSLQPLVENAIFHGIVPSGRNGTITINAYEDGNDLIITVEDDGIGIEPPELKELSDMMEKSKATGFTGIGLTNVNNRFKLSYGEKYGLVFESESGHYTKVIMRCPKETEG